MKKTVWIVMKNGEEVGRVSTKRLAESIAAEIGRYVNRYTVEWR